MLYLEECTKEIPACPIQLMSSVKSSFLDTIGRINYLLSWALYIFHSYKYYNCNYLFNVSHLYQTVSSRSETLFYSSSVLYRQPCRE